jgi:hypothetical protein
MNNFKTFLTAMEAVIADDSAQDDPDSPEEP